MKSLLWLGLALLVPTTALAKNSLSEPGISAAKKTTQVMPAPPISVAPPPTGLRAPSAASKIAPTAQASSLTASLFSDTISFDLPVGTAIGNQYQNEGIIFGGSGAHIIEDGSSANSPVLSGTPDFDGDITGQFVQPGTTDPLPVFMMIFDIGGFDEVGTVQLEFFDPQGNPLFDFVNDRVNFVRYAVRGGNKGIGSWRFSNFTGEPDGFGVDDIAFTRPGVSDLGSEMGVTACSLGNPVNPAVGNKYQVETDYQGARPFPLTVARSYNSLSGSWQFFPELDHSAGSNEARVVRPDGKRLTYGALSQTTWVPTSEDVIDTLATQLDANNNPMGWQYTTLDDQVEVYDIAGRMASITNRAGISHSFNYSNSEITVTHSLGGSITYTIDVNDRVTGFTDPAGNQYTYSYNTEGLLSGVVYPGNGESRTYQYEHPTHSDLLTSITHDDGDHAEIFATWNYDSERRATSSAHWGGAERVDFDYSFVDDPTYPQTQTTNALGKQTTYHFTKLNGVRKTFYLNGHESDNCVASNQVYGFYGSGFIYSKTDWNGNVTTYQRNDKGQELSRTEAKGSAQERTITTDWHATYNLPTKIIEPGRETTFTYDASGNLLGKSIADTAGPQGGPAD